MKKTLFSTMLIVTQMASAAIPIDGWYSSVFGGYAFLQGNLHHPSDDLFGDHDHYRSSYDAGASFGFKSAPLRYEGELTYLKAQLDHFKVNGIRQSNVNGTNQAGFAMANIYYDFCISVPAIEPFLGIGLGYGYVESVFNSNGPFAVTHLKSTDNVFAYQGTAGVTFNFAEEWALNVGYRYLRTDKVRDFGKPFQASMANIGGVYRFDGQIYK